MSDAIRDLAREQFKLLAAPARLASAPVGSPRSLLRLAAPLAPPSPLNDRISANRHLARASWPLADLKRVAGDFRATVNDVLLAATAGALRLLLLRNRLAPEPLKAMIPVSVRVPGEAGSAGNRISFMFLPLPLDEALPGRRLERVRLATGARKRGHDPDVADAVIAALGRAPRPLRSAVSRAVAGPRAFNLVVSNIPGPAERPSLLGCELEAVFPVVPLSEGPGLAVAMTTVGHTAHFGLHVDPAILPDADRLADDMTDALAELSRADPPPSGPKRTPPRRRSRGGEPEREMALA